MASRKQIKNTFLSELETALNVGTQSELVASSNIYHESSEVDEPTYPAVTYNEFGRKVRYNQGSSAAPSRYLDNTSGDITDEVYRSHYRLRFDVRVYGSDEIDKEPVYNAIVDHFSQYELWAGANAFHNHVRDVEVTDLNDEVDRDTESLVPIDIVTVEIEFYRETTRSGDPIEQVDHEVDADTDGSTAGDTYTTT